MGHPARLTRSLPEGTLVLVRHGESTWIAEGRFQGRGDPPLSALGQAQAGCVAIRLGDRQKRRALRLPMGAPAAIWHSPLRRARDTARAVADSLDHVAPLREMADLTEIDLGDWQGRLGGEIEAEYPGLLAAWRTSPTRVHAPGGESLEAAGQRVLRGFERVLDEFERVRASATPGAAGSGDHPWAVLVAHDGIFRLLLMTLLDVPFERFWSFPFALCAITTIELRQGLAALRAHNLTEHLTGIREVAQTDTGGAL